MTTVAMIAGMTPIVLGLGVDSSFRRPMAVAVIGGLLTSTGLSLLVVPVVYSYVDGFERSLCRWFGRTSGGSSSSPQPPSDRSATALRRTSDPPTRLPKKELPWCTPPNASLGPSRAWCS